MKKLKKGWVEGSIAEFLDLSPAEIELIETRRVLSKILRVEREKRKLTQSTLAQFLHSSQSRVAKMEKGDASVSLDLLFQSLYRLGISRRHLLKIEA